MIMRRLLISLGLGLFGCTSHADISEALTTAQSRYPDNHINQVTETPLPGIYQFEIGDEFFYSDKNARFLIVGTLIDTENVPDTTIDYSQIKGIAVELNQGNAGEVIIFTDPLCPYCSQLEKRIANGELYDFSVRLVFSPMLGGSLPIVKKLLCDPKPGQAYRRYIFENELPTNCINDLFVDHISATQFANIVATPTILAPNGNFHVGLLPEGDLFTWVYSNQK